MRTFLALLILAAVACSKTEPKTPEPSSTSNGAALERMRSEREAESAAAAGGGEPERMEAFSSLKLPDTPGNPTAQTVCAALYDASGRPVSAEGQFDVTSDFDLNGGIYVYPPMFGPLAYPGQSWPLGVCPASGGMWPDRLAQVRGTTAAIRVKFTSAAGKVLTAETSQAF